MLRVGKFMPGSNWRLALSAAALILGLGAPASGESPSLAMLDSLEPGLWLLRDREAEGGATQRICLRDARNLIQMRHPGASCERTVVSDGSTEVAIQYTCRGKGYGLTRIRRETRHLFQLQSQGVAAGLPFDFAIEARRIGNCTG